MRQKVRSKPGPETYNAVKWALELGSLAAPVMGFIALIYEYTGFYL